jgi:hypothetical protein
MPGNALFATTVIFLGMAFYLLQECTFLIPYRDLLYHKYGGEIATFAGLLFVNLLAGIFALSRHLFLKDTGDKLAHLEKQLRGRETISEELTRRIAREE